MSAVNNKRIAALASDRAVHRAFAWLHLHEAQMRRWQMAFLGIAAPPFGEAERAAWFCARFGEMGLSDARVDAAGNAVAELRTDGARNDGASAGPVVMISAHLDTVFPAGTDCTPREEEAKILGPGACDNGAGLTALLGLAAALRHAEILPGCTILCAANVGEEGEGDLRGMRHLFAETPYAGRVRAAIALEGSGDAMVVDRALGSRRLRVSIAGPGGHSWADAGRANPIMALAAALGPNLTNAMLAIGVVRVPFYVRVARGQALSLRERPYVKAAQTFGASRFAIVARHIVPNAMAPIIVQGTLDIGIAILTASALSFIGLGAQEPTAEWGAMVADGRDFLLDQWWYPTFPGLAILVTAVGFNLLGDGLRDILDPKQRGR